METVKINIEKDCVDITNVTPKALDAFLEIQGNPDAVFSVDDSDGWTVRDRRDLANLMGWGDDPMTTYWVTGGC